MIYGYDLESERIDAGTPKLLYFTSYSRTPAGPDKISAPLYYSPNDSHDRRYEIFRDLLDDCLLLPQRNGAQFVAWNGNKFDAYFIVKALLKSDKWELHPFMTASKSLRGVRVKSRERYRYKDARTGKLVQRILQFQFLDGIAMTGIVGKKLKSFLQTFAPELPKLDLDLSEEGIEFDSSDEFHVRYAERDSEGLYVAMEKVAGILTELTGAEKLKPTIGNLAINYFMDTIPDGAQLFPPTGELLDVLHGPLKRGGYCWCMRQYRGPVWKYDINQAYAAAMRDERLPAGFVTSSTGWSEDFPGVYEVSISRARPSPVPFYFKPSTDSDSFSCGPGEFTTGKYARRMWLTSTEIFHLLRDNWDVEYIRGYHWRDSFTFAGTVNRLETLRRSDPEGPSGPLGTMVKAIGNNAYGKTLEKPNGEEFIIANECPPGYDLYDPFDPLAENVFSRHSLALTKRHHLPQIGIFVTAHVRCKVREVALKAPGRFLYADTDCVVFSEDMSHSIDIDPARYGAWKEEAAGEQYLILGKKIYHGQDGTLKAKGLHTRQLTADDFDTWLDGTPPKQVQIQRNNLLKFLAGRDMFRSSSRHGTDVGNSKVYLIDEHRIFQPREREC